MGQGQDKIARSLLDIQPTAVLEFFRIYPDTVEKPDIFIPIHGGSIFGNNVTWQGVEYIPVPVEGEGFEINGNGQLARPKIRMANKDFLITSLLQNNSDFKNAKIVRKRTFLKYLDDVNFDGGNPFGSQDFTAEISNETFLIGQKTAENKVFVEFELTSPLDLENFEVTHRKILAKYCYWSYRGHGCNYAGIPVEKENGFKFTDSEGKSVVPNFSTDGFATNPNYLWSSTKTYNKKDIVYLENPKIFINAPPLEPKGYSGPMQTWYVCVENEVTNKNPQNNPSSWEKDGCRKSVGACKQRFASSSTEEANAIFYTFPSIDYKKHLKGFKPLPFGGFPGTDGFSYGG
jgi:lambda family phage minor tail protein L